VSLAILGLIVLISYLLGSIPFGYLVGRLRGVDIFQHGSGNIGATNVGRVLGRGYGLLVFVLDFMKGAIPAGAGLWLAQAFPQTLDILPGSKSLAVVAGLAAFLGHLFPIYLRFHGGKGIATGAGVVANVLPVPAVASLLVWIGVLCAWRYVSLASLAAAGTLLLTHLVVSLHPWNGSDLVLTLFCLMTAVLIVVRHRANIARLLQGNENRLRESLAMHQFTKTLHVVVLGLWFGMLVFFQIATLQIFHSFENLGQEVQTRPAWMPVTPDFDKEKGTRLAGIAVAPLFDVYFPLQGVYGFLALMTALAWSRAGPLHRLRVAVLLMALVTVIVGWPLGHHVNTLRIARYAADADVAAKAKAAFGSWHTYSLFLNFFTIILVAMGMALAARLPELRPGTASSKPA
jgi:acyl-phosphate glycerol 3-phosphate acyltransferase